MDQHHLRVFTHEYIVHTQIELIQQLLKRDIQFTINMNVKDERPNIQFFTSREELDLLSNTLGHTIFIKTEDKWRPYF